MQVLQLVPAVDRESAGHLEHRAYRDRQALCVGRALRSHVFCVETQSMLNSDLTDSEIEMAAHKEHNQIAVRVVEQHSQIRGPGTKMYNTKRAPSHRSAREVLKCYRVLS